MTVDREEKSVATAKARHEPPAMLSKSDAALASEAATHIVATTEEGHEPDPDKRQMSSAVKDNFKQAAGHAALAAVATAGAIAASNPVVVTFGASVAAVNFLMAGISTRLAAARYSDEVRSAPPAVPPADSNPVSRKTPTAPGR